MMRSAEAIVVAKQTILRCSSCAVIARRSTSCRQRDLVVDDGVDLERKKKQDHVWEMRMNEVKQTLLEGKPWAVRAHQNRRRRLAVTARF
jgi:hypothetical protein